jgi:hypothetical protein
MLTLWELGQWDEAIEHARKAYEQAWHDGPPNCDYWGLRDARELLLAMDESIPALRIVDADDVKVPLEDEVRAFIADLELKRSSR